MEVSGTEKFDELNIVSKRMMESYILIGLLKDGISSIKSRRKFDIKELLL